MIDFFYSDAHFGHQSSNTSIIELADRPFKSIDEHDAELIRRYNYLVHPDDVVLFLGDTFLCNATRAQQITDSLNGRKISLLGNHCLNRSARWIAKLGFVVVEGEILLQLGEHSVRVSHFPYAGTAHNKGDDKRNLELRPVRRKGEVLIHGHTHTKIQYRDGAVHVGVDAWDYYPVPVEAIIEILNAARIQ
ncbi:MAG: hypothetical protein PHC68_04140 [Syntrophorhabdaceae bacterium]|nr:hypothetical protein [Syntrophorhabdaceae bacterium]